MCSPGIAWLLRNELAMTLGKLCKIGNVNHKTSNTGLLSQIDMMLLSKFNVMFEVFSFISNLRTDINKHTKMGHKFCRHWILNNETDEGLAVSIINKIRDKEQGKVSAFIKTIASEALYLFAADRKAHAVASFIPLMLILIQSTNDFVDRDKVNKHPIFIGGHINGKAKQLSGSASIAEKRSNVYLHPGHRPAYDRYARVGGFRVTVDSQMDLMQWCESISKHHSPVIIDPMFAMSLFFEPINEEAKKHPAFIECKNNEKKLFDIMKKSNNLHDILVIDVHVEPPIEESPRDGAGTPGKPQPGKIIDRVQAKSKIIDLANHVSDAGRVLKSFGVSGLSFTQSSKFATNTTTDAADKTKLVDEVKKNKRIVKTLTKNLNDMKEELERMTKQVIGLGSICGVETSGNTVEALLQDEYYRLMKLNRDPSKLDIKQLILQTKFSPQNPDFDYHDTVQPKWELMGNSFGYIISEDIPEYEVFPDDINEAFAISPKTGKSSTKSLQDIILSSAPSDKITETTNIYQIYTLWSGHDKKYICNIDILRDAGIRDEVILQKVEFVIWMLHDTWTNIRQVLETYSTRI